MKLDKVILGLECCATEPETKDHCWGLNCPYQSEKHCMTALHRDALKSLKDPDRVKIVRCEDCRHWERDEGYDEGKCLLGHKDDAYGLWFCADGEEKTDDEA